MKISLKLLSQFGIDLKEFKADPLKLSDLLTNAGLEVEEIKNLSKQFENVVVGHIIEKNKHPNADQLTLCLVDTGDKKRKIVCGAKNHNAGDKVVVALPGAVLPGNFAIKLSKIRGEESEGMLCSEKELGLNSTSEGIIILPSSAPVGESYAAYSKSDDIIFDIKVTPNRSDCLSHYGIIRELSAHLDKKTDPILTPFSEGRESTKKLIKVIVEDSERCPRYAGRVLKNIKVAPSPEWLKKAIESLNLRSINNVVDITNFVMMMYGQPLHAFDMSKIKGGQIIVRSARVGEKFTSLDEKNLTFNGTELIIADSDRPIALAGVMGGFDSGISDSTTDIFIEAAVFNAASVRRTSKLYGMDSDASYRFSRGVDPEGVVVALNKCCQLLAELCEGQNCSDHYDIYPRPLSRSRIELDLKFISSRLGFTVESTEGRKILEKLGCVVSGSVDKLLVNPPAFRPDLKLAEDLGEEILRFKGFAQIPETLPASTSKPTNDDKGFSLENKLAELFIGLGFNQAVNLNLVSSEFEGQVLGNTHALDLKEIGFDLVSSGVKIRNPLNIELNVMRKFIIPSLLKNAHYNLSHGNGHGRLFEIAPVFALKESADLKEKRPFYEETHLALISWGKSQNHWSLKEKSSEEILSFFELKGAVESFFENWAFKSVKFQPLKNAPDFLHPGQSAQITVEGKTVGILGSLHPGLVEKLNIKTNVVVCELNLKTLFLSQPRQSRSKEVSKFPAMERDVALLVPETMLASDVKAELLKAAGPLAQDCDLFDLYSGAGMPEGMRSLAFRLKYQDSLKTLADEEINTLHQKAVKAVCAKLHLSVR